MPTAVVLTGRGVAQMHSRVMLYDRGWRMK